MLAFSMASAVWNIVLVTLPCVCYLRASRDNVLVTLLCVLFTCSCDPVWRAHSVGDASAAARWCASNRRAPVLCTQRWIPRHPHSDHCVQHGPGVYGWSLHAQVALLVVPVNGFVEPRRHIALTLQRINTIAKWSACIQSGLSDNVPLWGRGSPSPLLPLWGCQIMFLCGEGNSEI